MFFHIKTSMSRGFFPTTPAKSPAAWRTQLGGVLRRLDRIAAGAAWGTLVNTGELEKHSFPMLIYFEYIHIVSFLVMSVQFMSFHVIVSAHS